MRKTKELTIAVDATPNRDAGKRFLITEMSARSAEDWAIRAILAITSSGIEISDDARDAGAAGVIAEGVRNLLRIKPADAAPLLDEMMSCVQVYDTHHNAFRDLALDDDIEEISTRFQLRGEVVELHTGFPVAAALSTLGAAARRSMVSQNTPTSPSPSEPSSAAD